MHRKIHFIVLLLMITTLVLSACGPGAPEVAPPEAEAEVEEAPEAKVEEEPEVEEAEPNIAVYSHVGTPDLDPSTSASDDVVVTTNVYETLTFYNPPGSAETIGPKLATSWESSDDAMNWTFHLREGVKFHDGTDFNAEAVKFSIEYTMDRGGAWLTSSIRWRKST
ncbi:MAG: ABC transporter substrate-binding protein [Anaerolineales bacterium]